MLLAVLQPRNLRFEFRDPEPEPEELTDPQRAPAHFGEIIDFAAAQRTAPSRQLTRLLGHLEAAGWAPLAHGLRTLISGEPVSLALDEIDSAIIAFAQNQFRNP